MGPVPLRSREMDKPSLPQVIEDFGHVMTTELLLSAERQFECRALKMADQNVYVLGIDQTHLRRLAEEILGMVDDELIQRRAGRDQHGNGHPGPTAGAAHAL